MKEETHSPSMSAGPRPLSFPSLDNACASHQCAGSGEYRSYGTLTGAATTTPSYPDRFFNAFATYLLVLFLNSLRSTHSPRSSEGPGHCLDIAATHFLRGRQR